MSDTKGLYLGKSHAEGGIAAVNTDTGQQLEIEGQEYKVCNSAYSSNKILRYSNKTNKEILDDIHDNFSCRFNKNEVKNGEFILCKVVVLDPTKRSRKGTVRQILDEMQSEKSCNVSQGAAELSLGGKIGAEGKRVEFILDGQNRERFEISDRNAKLDEIKVLRLCKKSLEVNNIIDTFVKDILPFWEGYDFYPDIKDVKIEFDPNFPFSNSTISYNTKSDKIQVNSKKIIDNYDRGSHQTQRKNYEASSSFKKENEGLLSQFVSKFRQSLRGQFFHEIQHCIQNREGIKASVSNPYIILKKLKEINGKQHFSDKDFIDYIEKKEGREYRFIEYDFYQNLPSEKEALQVEKRSFLTKKQLKEKPFEFEQGGEISEDEKIYKEWTELVNMSASELKAFMKTDEGKDAGLDPKEAKRLGIKSGQESARWIIKMKSTNKDKWTLTMWDWAKRQINFIKRMRGNKGKLFDENGIKTRKHTSLLIWGYDPLKKMAQGGEVGFDWSNRSYNKDTKELRDIISKVFYGNEQKAFSMDFYWDKGGMQFIANVPISSVDEANDYIENLNNQLNKTDYNFDIDYEIEDEDVNVMTVFFQEGKKMAQGGEVSDAIEGVLNASSAQEKIDFYDEMEGFNNQGNPLEIEVVETVEGVEPEFYFWGGEKKKWSRFGDKSKEHTVANFIRYDSEGNADGILKVITKGAEKGENKEGLFKIAVKNKGEGIAKKLLDRANKTGIDLVKYMPINSYSPQGRAMAIKWLKSKA